MLYGLFALVTAVISGMMLTRLDRRNMLDARVDPGRLGGRYFDDESGREVVYRVKRLPIGMSVSWLAGYVSGALGIGGGILKVPTLNLWCGVPLRAAAATSGLMIGVTAVASIPIHYANGYILPGHAASAGARRAARIAGGILVRRSGTGAMAETADGVPAVLGLDAVPGQGPIVIDHCGRRV